MTPTPGTLRLLATLGAVPELQPRAGNAFPPSVTWEDGPCGRSAARALVTGGFTVGEHFWGGALVDVPDLEPCVFQRVLRPVTAAILYLHGPEPDSAGGDADLAARVFATDLPGVGLQPHGLENELAVHLLLGEVGDGCDFGGDGLFAAMGAAIRRTFGDRRGLFEIARHAVI
ncbi:hypothetical protein GCM10010168_30590 [Actinoplanes ianthinogenes]|uniref:Uncharacterized protein n=1 Tax=Actinoplanes ianthinogenes TaxID=122358 RepID=A0ABM7LLM1_9ACTN|nr:hypothetical protein [Actinoplanes ianthinogenes]BCJ40201.1 hypothetical protein Aiant_08580 [Actinoplanes ianthinogenes]GGR10933.1 hypothetical protein GCM10010168_30590 [Actinoplanes ianthinogenes]